MVSAVRPMLVSVGAKDRRYGVTVWARSGGAAMLPPIKAMIEAEVTARRWRVLVADAFRETLSEGLSEGAAVGLLDFHLQQSIKPA